MASQAEGGSAPHVTSSPAASYLASYDIESFTQALTRRLSLEKPQDPYSVICDEASKWRGRWFEASAKWEQPGFSTRLPNSVDYSAEDKARSGEVKDDEPMVGHEQALEAVVACITPSSQSADMSEAIARSVAKMRLPNEAPWQQDCYYEGSGLHSLLRDAAEVKPVFDAIGERLASEIRDEAFFGQSTRFFAAPRKGMARAEAKTRVSFLHDASQLTDCVRGTLILDLPVKQSPQDVARHVYEVINTVIHGFTAAGARVIHFDDRYLTPLGKYSDWLLLVKVHGYICELQINFGIAVQRKEKQQHVAFEKDRKLRDALLESAILDDLPGVMKVIQEVTSVDVCDKVNRLTALHYASAHGNGEMVKILLEGSADVLAVDSCRQIPLSRAITKKLVDVSNILLEAMSKEEVLPNYYLATRDIKVAFITCLDTALRMKLDDQIPKIEHLAHMIFPDALEALFFAAEAGLPNIISLILADDEVSLHGPPAHPVPVMDNPEAIAADLLNVPKMRINNSSEAWRFRIGPFTGRVDKVSILDMAVLGGSVPCASLLAKFGAQLHPAGPHANPQEAACRWVKDDKPGRLAALLAIDDLAPRHMDNYAGTIHGAKDEHGRHVPGGEWGHVPGTPLDRNVLADVALRHGKQKSLHVLLQSGMILTGHPLAGNMLRAAAGKGDLSHVQELIKAKAEVDSPDSNGRTALWIASVAGHSKITKCLLQAKADANVEDCLHFTPWEIALRHNNLKIMKRLCKFGADLYKCSPSDPKRFPAYSAAIMGKVAMLETLQQAGMDLGRPIGAHGLTAGHGAASNGQIKTLRWLHENGVDLFRSNDKGPSVLEVSQNSPNPTALSFLQTLSSSD
eukprot:TRINITY_DN15811_c0_g1_i2.p1 TRINITY_DN15811_c0_g1~~TRINITY_DN15811_c0_g1_i2.p1  ORF type:complete len:973 (-),score=125.92 TRINITY_DN15811_c0_g1_i2:366-2930(-)